MFNRKLEYERAKKLADQMYENNNRQWCADFMDCKTPMQTLMAIERQEYQDRMDTQI